MPHGYHATWVTPVPQNVRPCMNDMLQAMPSVYNGSEDYFKPGEGNTNEEYSRYNHTCANPYISESLRNYYKDFHTFERSIYPNRHWHTLR